MQKQYSTVSCRYFKGNFKSENGYSKLLEITRNIKSHVVE